MLIACGYISRQKIMESLPELNVSISALVRFFPWCRHLLSRPHLRTRSWCCESGLCWKRIFIRIANGFYQLVPSTIRGISRFICPFHHAFLYLYFEHYHVSLLLLSAVCNLYSAIHWNGKLFKCSTTGRRKIWLRCPVNH